MEPPNFKWALPNVAILALPDHPEMYKWMVDQGISKLYSVHSMVPKQIKAVKKLENELIKKHPYQQLSVDELLGFIDIIKEAELFGKKIGKNSVSRKMLQNGVTTSGSYQCQVFDGHTFKFPASP